MSIKTWRERSTDRGIGSCEARDEEIDELRAALDKRDAEIERLKTVPMKYRRMTFNAELQEKVEAQRVVLEQALRALVYHTDQTRPIRETGEAITAIQGVLK